MERFKYSLLNNFPFHLFQRQKSGPCMTAPCFHSVECHNVGNGSFECESCPEGFQGDGQTCTDVNEVLTTMNGKYGKLVSRCTDTGSYKALLRYLRNISEIQVQELKYTVKSLLYKVLILSKHHVKIRRKR